MSRLLEEIVPRAVKQCRLQAGHTSALKQHDPSSEIALKLKKKEEKKLFEELHERLAELQDLLYAQHLHKVLIVLQGMDAAGKDSTIAHVFKGVNPQGVRVASFKVPAQEEADHDYLWRIHSQMPKKGQMVIFNRSHYEDVVAARVHKAIGPKEWLRRYRQINDFERMLCEEGTVILKFFLHIDKDEQKKRLEERLKDPHKNWKFNSLDMKERKLWPRYMQAYDEALCATSTSWAAWHIIPSNKKWNRNLAVMLILIDAFTQLRMHYPKAIKGYKAG